MSAAVVVVLAGLVVVLVLAGLVLSVTHRSRRRSTMPTNQTTDEERGVLPDGYDDEASPFYVHPELQPHYRADPADRRAVDKEAVIIMLTEAAEVEVARAVEREQRMAGSGQERVFTRPNNPAGAGHFMQDRAWRQSHEAMEPTAAHLELAEHVVRLDRAKVETVRERQAAEYRALQVAQLHCRVCRDEDDLVTQVRTLVDGSTVRSHARCALAVNAALLAGVTDVEWAAAADYVRPATGDADGEPAQRWTVRTHGRPRQPAGALDAGGASQDGPGQLTAGPA